MERKNVLSIRNLTKDYGTKGFRTQVLKGIELDIMANDFIAIMGPSGSGKTTLLEETIRQLNSDATLVCPAMFDLGEAKKVVIVSTTEGDDKPLKYPHIFLEADVCVINKIDLAPYLDTDVETLRNNTLKVNHHLQLFEVSATKGTGMDAWCDWLVKECAKCK